MSQTVTDDKPGKPRRTRLYVSVALFAILPLSGAIWAFVDRALEAADRAQ